jgi:hypothetical protein
VFVEASVAWRCTVSGTNDPLEIAGFMDMGLREAHFTKRVLAIHQLRAKTSGRAMKKSDYITKLPETVLIVLKWQFFRT